MLKGCTVQRLKKQSYVYVHAQYPRNMYHCDLWQRTDPLSRQMRCPKGAQNHISQPYTNIWSWAPRQPLTPRSIGCLLVVELLWFWFKLLFFDYPENGGRKLSRIFCTEVPRDTLSYAKRLVFICKVVRNSSHADYPTWNPWV